VIILKQAGVTQPGRDNHSGRIQVQTLQERLISELGLSHHEVATFASWETMHNAVQHMEGAHFVNAGIEHYKDPHHRHHPQHGDALDGATHLDAHDAWLKSIGDSVRKMLNRVMMEKTIDDLNAEQHATPPPWHHARYDKFTFAFALRYLVRYKPRFMFIGLNDSDDTAHLGDYEGYINALRNYDHWLHLLVQTLNELGVYGRNTTIIITTDHGRGEGDQWVDHGGEFSMGEAKPVWLAAMGPHTLSCGTLLKCTHLHSSFYQDLYLQVSLNRNPIHLHDGQENRDSNNTSVKLVKKAKKVVFTHLDIRPTIEQLMGLKPIASPFHGRVLPEVVYYKVVIKNQLP
jgi:hypothetical protein